MNSAFEGYKKSSRPRRALSTSDNTLLDLPNSSYPTKPLSLIAKLTLPIPLIIIQRLIVVLTTWQPFFSFHQHFFFIFFFSFFIFTIFSPIVKFIKVKTIPNVQLSNRKRFPCLHSLIYTRERLGEFETVMQTGDEVKGLHKWREFSQPLECLYQEIQTQEKRFLLLL